MQNDAIVANAGRFFAACQQGIVCAWLFGSRARRTARADSDVDLAVLLDHAPGHTLADSSMALAGELEAELGAPVDLVILNDAPVDLIHRVLRDGIIVFERDRLARIRFEVQARNVYFDLKPYLDEYRRAPRAKHR